METPKSINELEPLYREILRLESEDASADKLREAKYTARAALSKRAEEITQAISERVRNDPAIQELLADAWLAAFISNDPAVHPYGLHGAVTWASVLEAVFPGPNSALIEAREAAFREAWGVPLLASMEAD